MRRGPYRIQKVAEMLGLHPDTVRDLCNRGLIACTRTEGGHRRITAAALDAYVARLTSNARAA